MAEHKTYQDLDEKIIYSIFFVSIFVATIYVFYDLIFAYYGSALVDFMVVIICASSYYLIRYKNAYKYIAIPTIFVIFSLCIADFFLKNGFYGSASINFLIIGFVIALVFYGSTRNIMLVTYFTIIGGLAYIQLFKPSLISHLYEKQNIWSIFFYFIVYTALLMYLAVIIRKEYKKEKEENIAQKKVLLKQGKQITEKTQEIVAQQEEVTSFNEQLELLVSKRTEQLAYQNKQLDDYIHFNTVKVSDPLQQLNTLASVISQQLSDGKLEEAQFQIADITHLAIKLDIIF